MGGEKRREATRGRGSPGLGADAPRWRPADGGANGSGLATRLGRARFWTGFRTIVSVRAVAFAVAIVIMALAAATGALFELPVDGGRRRRARERRFKTSPTGPARKGVASQVPRLRPMRGYWRGPPGPLASFVRVSQGSRRSRERREPFRGSLCRGREASGAAEKYRYQVAEPSDVPGLVSAAEHHCIRRVPRRPEKGDNAQFHER